MPEGRNADFARHRTIVKFGHMNTNNAYLSNQVGAGIWSSVNQLSDMMPSIELSNLLFISSVVLHYVV